MKKILFFANFIGDAENMSLLIRDMLSRYSVEPILLCDGCAFDTEQFRVIHFRKQQTYVSTAPEKVPVEGGTERKAIHRQISVFYRNLRSMYGMERRAKYVLSKIKPDAIVIAEDLQNGLLQGVLKHAGNIPVIYIRCAVIPHGHSNRRYSLELEVTDKKTDINYLAAKINPDWALTEDGTTRLYYPAGQLLAGYVMKMISMHPWAGGAHDAITCAMVPRHTDKDRILQYVNKKVIVTGMIEEYAIKESTKEGDSLRENLCNKYRDLGDRIAVFAMPQMPEHGVTTWEIHRHNVRLLMRELCSRYGTILISLHPRSRREDYEFVADEFDAVFLDERIRDILPGTDVVICVDSSSVVNMAEVIGKYCLAIPTWKLRTKIDSSENMEELLSEQRYDSHPFQPLNVADEIMKVLAG